MMRKLILAMLLMAGGLTLASADSYSYLTFETTDGAKTSVAIASLTLTVSGTTLTAGSQTFTLSNLTKMYFSTTDETTGIATLKADLLDDVLEIYDLRGKKVAKDRLAKGVYIVKTKKGNYKIVTK